MSLSFSNGRDTHNVIAIWQRDFMRRYDYKTKRDAYKNMDWCRAKRSEGKISMTPHKRDNWDILQVFRRRRRSSFQRRGMRRQQARR
jgi:CDI immunity protein